MRRSRVRDAGVTFHFGNAISQLRQRCCAARFMLAIQILIDGFAISSLYAPRRRRLHADLRRFRRAQSRARRDHGRGGGGRMARRRRTRSRHLCRRAGRGVGRDWSPPTPRIWSWCADSDARRAIPRGEGDLRPHRHAALGHHDPGRHGLSVHRQSGDHPPADLRRGQHFRRAHAGERNPDRSALPGPSSDCSGSWSIGRAPARRCSAHR
jgi:hypothetical protein